MALRSGDDTEFNDALRAHGILQPRQDAQRSPSPDMLPVSSAQRLREDAALEDEDLLDLEDDLPASVLDAYRQSRMAEMSTRISKYRFGNGLLEISRDDYTREVTEASKLDVDDDAKTSARSLSGNAAGTGVVCFLYKDSIPESKLMRQHLETLSRIYPATKFVSIPGSRCIENYPDKNIPTLLVYRNGEMRRQLIGLGTRGLSTKWQDIEGVLVACGSVDLDLKNEDATPKENNGSDDDDDDDDQ